MREPIVPKSAVADYLFHFDSPLGRISFGRQTKITGWLLHRLGLRTYGIRGIVRGALRRRSIFKARRKRSPIKYSATSPFHDAVSSIVASRASLLSAAQARKRNAVGSCGKEEIRDIWTYKQEPGFPNESVIEPGAHATLCWGSPVDKNPTGNRDALVVNRLIRPRSINAFMHLRELFESLTSFLRHNSGVIYELCSAIASLPSGRSTHFQSLPPTIDNRPARHPGCKGCRLM